MALQIFQYCLGAAKAGYFMNTTPLAVIKEAIDIYDSEIHAGVEDVFNVSLSENDRKELALPQTMGGLNLRISTELADAAYIGSLVHTHQLRNKLLKRPADTISIALSESLDRFNQTHAKDVSMQFILALSKPQKHLSAIVNSNIRSKLSRRDNKSTPQLHHQRFLFSIDIYNRITKQLRSDNPSTNSSPV